MIKSRAYTVVTKSPRKPRGAFGLDTQRVPTEAETHKAVLAYLRTVLPDAIVFHPANGGSRDIREAVNLKSMGVMAGVPDLCIIHSGRAYFLEVKRAKGARVSDHQHQFWLWCQSHQTPMAFVTSIDDARRALVAWELPIREAGQ